MSGSFVIEKEHYRAFARVHLDAIEENFDGLKKCLKPGVRALAIIKADAYGHGSIQIAKLLEKKADYFGVASLEEALALREVGITTPILILSFVPESCFEKLILHSITTTVTTLSAAKKLSDTALSLGRKALVHVAVDTGMGRIGFVPDEAGADAVKEVSLLPGLCLEGVFSHFATADEKDKTPARAQIALFDRFLSLLNQRGVTIPIKHICNTAGVTDLDAQYDMCRLGIALYGLYPSGEVDRSRVTLRPAMEVFSHVVFVKEVEKGTPIGYGHTYIAPKKQKIATVSIGYADGFSRSLSSHGYVLVNGKRAQIVGRVCMDLIMVDVTGIETREGDVVTIIGKSGEEEISAEEIGRLSGSFNYEVICTFMPRVARIYCRGGKEI